MFVTGEAEVMQHLCYKLTQHSTRQAGRQQANDQHRQRQQKLADVSCNQLVYVQGQRLQCRFRNTSTLTSLSDPIASGFQE